MSNLQLKFRGGFAWVFSAADTATVGLIRAPVSSKFQHHMIMTVDRSRVVKDETTHAETEPREENSASYELTGPLTLAIDDQPLPPLALTRFVSTSLPPHPNNFFHVYSIERLIGMKPPSLRRDWRDQLTVSVNLSAGILSVLDRDRVICTFEDEDRTQVGDRRALATTITYTSTSSVGSHVEIADSSGKIRLSTAPAVIVDINAVCDCGSVTLKNGERLPGFEDVFELYPPLQPQFRIHPLKATEIKPASVKAVAAGPVTPGPDCPPTDHQESQ